VSAAHKVVSLRREFDASRQRLALLRGQRHAARIDADHEQVRALEEEIQRVERGES
jgi:hypothetical protein